jgi:hypothetical protein
MEGKVTQGNRRNSKILKESQKWESSEDRWPSYEILERSFTEENMSKILLHL